MKGSRLLVVGRADHDTDDPAAVFWRLINRVDWQQDLLLSKEGLTVDARRLRGIPVQPDREMVARVLSRWSEYRITQPLE